METAFSLSVFVVGVLLGWSIGALLGWWFGRTARPVPPSQPVQKRDLVTVQLLDEDEQAGSTTFQLDAALRRPHLMSGGQEYTCVRRDRNGVWLYRRIAQ